MSKTDLEAVSDLDKDEPSDTPCYGLAGFTVYSVHLCNHVPPLKRTVETVSERLSHTVSPVVCTSNNATPSFTEVEL